MDIWAKFKSVTGAQEVQATEVEEEELAELQRQRETAEVDRKRVAEIRKNKKDQEKMLQAARGEVERLRAG
jgi:large subunit ribosomal protein MRP49